MDSISASTFAGSFARVLASGRRMSDTGSSITRAAALARTLIGRRVRSCAGAEARRGGRARRRVGRRARQCEAIGATLHAATTLSSASVATALLPSRRARAQHTHTQKAKAPTRRVARRPSRKAAGTSLAAELQAVRLRRVVSGPSALSPPDGRWQRLEGCARSQVKCTGRANPRMEDVLNQPLSQSEMRCLEYIQSCFRAGMAMVCSSRRSPSHCYTGPTYPTDALGRLSTTSRRREERAPFLSACRACGRRPAAR